MRTQATNASTQSHMTVLSPPPPQDEAASEKAPTKGALDKQATPAASTSKTSGYGSISALASRVSSKTSGISPTTTPTIAGGAFTSKTSVPTYATARAF